MRTQFRILIVSALFTVLLSGNAFAQQAAALSSGRTFSVGFAQDTMANDWRISQVKTLQRELARYPFIRFSHTDAKGRTAQQILDVENYIASKVDVLVTSPSDAQALAPVIARAHRAGIPVVLLSRTIVGEDYTIFITGDNRDIGRQAAQFMVKSLGGKGKILVLQGLPTATTAIARTEGFEREIAKHSGMRIVAIKPANYLRGKAIQAVEQVIASGIKFDAIYAQSDSMASGARLALKNSRLDPRRILTVGIDYISEARAAIRAGEQAASFTYPTYAEEGARFIVKILRGEAVPKKVVVRSKIVTRDNVEEIKPIF